MPKFVITYIIFTLHPKIQIFIPNYILFSLYLKANTPSWHVK